MAHSVGVVLFKGHLDPCDRIQQGVLSGCWGTVGEEDGIVCCVCWGIVYGCCVRDVAPGCGTFLVPGNAGGIPGGAFIDVYVDRVIFLTVTNAPTRTGKDVA